MRTRMIIGGPRRANTRNRHRPRSQPMLNPGGGERERVPPDLVATIRIEPGKARRPTTTARQRPIVLAGTGRVPQKQAVIEALGFVLALLLVAPGRGFGYVGVTALLVMLQHVSSLFALARLPHPPSRHFPNKPQISKQIPVIPKRRRRANLGLGGGESDLYGKEGARKKEKRSRKNKRKAEMEILRRHA